MLAILAPGQGAQKQGFLTPWLRVNGVRESLEQASEVVRIDLVAAGTTMSDTDITDTAIAQPLIVAASLATAAALPPLPPSAVVAGHSVGEFTAAALCGALTPETALRLVATRGAAMAAASRTTAGGMTAVLGGDPAEVAHAVAAAGCEVANWNAPGQVVAAGTLDALAHLERQPPARSRLRPLAVAGAFHTRVMAPARDALAEHAGGVAPTRAQLGMVSNADGTVVTNGAETLSRLVSQVCSPVRWDLCMRTMSALGVTAIVELAPAGTLTAIVKRTLPHVTAVALREPDDLPAAQTLIEEHTVELADAAPPWQVVVAPARGTASLDPQAASQVVDVGDVVVRVTTRTEAVAVRATSAGHIVEWLVHDGDPVSEGQPLARISAEAFA